MAGASGATILAVTLLALGCNGREPAQYQGGDEDMTAAAPGPDLAGPCDDDHPCAAGQRCQAGSCVVDHGRCMADPDCLGDTWCDCGGGGGGPCQCVPWGGAPRGAWEPTCRRPPYDLSEVVRPHLLCAYISDGVETTPLVGDIDGDGVADIVFMTTGGALHAMRGTDCAPMFDQPFDFAQWNASQLAMGDLDGDGKPEIVGFESLAAGGGVRQPRPADRQLAAPLPVHRRHRGAGRRGHR